jgi:hypothetical protein
MNESLVLSKDLSQKLVEEGIVLDTEFWWVNIMQDGYPPRFDIREKGAWLETSASIKYPAPLTDELLRVMPMKNNNLRISAEDAGYWVDFAVTGPGASIFANTLPNALGSLILVPEVLAVVKQNMKGK